MSRQAVKQHTAHFLQLAEQHFSEKFHLPEIRMDLSGKTAGYFKQLANGKTIINYNWTFFQQNPDDFMLRTIPHEVAHLVAYQCYGAKIRPHGKEWKVVMALFGADDARCHNYDLTDVKARQYRQFHYQCGCRFHRLTSIRHNRILNGQQYICVQCKQPLSYHG